MSPPPPQSRFQEGSMNDRTSNAPPPDFLGPEPEDYERQFAMDWKPPDLDGFDNASTPHAAAPTPLGPQHHRGSFLSTSSGGSGGGGNKAAAAAAAAAAAGPQRQTGSGPGFFKQVRERLSLTRSKSSFSVTTGDEHDGADSAGGFHIPPVFKHKRSESMGVPTSLRNGAGGGHHQHRQHQHQHQHQYQQQQRPDLSFLRRNTVDYATRTSHDNTSTFTRVTTNATAPPAPFFEASPPPAPQPSLPGAGPLLPTFDPTRRPTREEIAANYQNLLASGFFGTHAIQSTRFSAPGSALHGRDSRTSFSASSQRLVDDEGASQGIRTVPPSPERMPPPPPPPDREAPPPPPPVLHAEPMEMEDSPSEMHGLPRSDTAVFSPAASADMPPLPALATAKKLRPAHHHAHSYSSATAAAPSAARPDPQHSRSFSTVPYSTTNAGAAPIMAARPPPTATAPPQRAYRPPPSSSARFSTESAAARPRGSFDFSGLSRGSSGRGLKRPFASTLANGSQTSFGSGGYDSGIGVATSTPEEKHESGARKFVKRLRKSASKISINLGSTMSQQSLQKQHFDDDDEMMQDDDDDCGSSSNNNLSLEQPSSRTSMSSSIKGSFSFRFGAGGKPDMASDGLPPTTSTDHRPFSSPPPSHHHHPSSSSSSPRPNFFGGASATGDDRNRFSLNSRHGSTGSPSPAPFPAAHSSVSPGLSVIVGSPNSDTATEQHRSRLRKREIFRSRRPRRYDGNAGLDTEASPPSPTPPQLTLGTGAGGDVDASGDGMEGVEFSFHFPGRKRPGMPLGPVPDANRGVLGGVVTTSGFPGIFKGGGGGQKGAGVLTRGGSVRVVPRDLI